MTAEKAREMADWKINNDLEHQYEIISNIIEQIAQDGKYQHITYRELSEDTKSRLIVDGFKIKEIGERGKEMLHTEISWRK